MAVLTLSKSYKTAEQVSYHKSCYIPMCIFTKKSEQFSCELTDQQLNVTDLELTTTLLSLISEENSISCKYAVKFSRLACVLFYY